MTDKAILFKASGEWEFIKPNDGKKFSLEELQKYVGGYIELIRLPGRECLVVNEEGVLLGLPLNQTITEAISRPIVGDVVYTPSKLV